MHREAIVQRQGSVSEELRAATAQVHLDAERSTFMTVLMAGALPKAEYGRLLAQYAAVYATLEAAAAVMRHDPLVGGFVDPALARHGALEADLVTLFGPGWPTSVGLTPETHCYLDRIRSRCFTSGPSFVGHHYVRYLGDLSGGQRLRRVLGRHYGLTDERGLRFYVFDQLPNSAAAKRAYRERLDATAWTPEQRDELLSEAVRAFELNIALFASLSDSLGDDVEVVEV